MSHVEVKEDFVMQRVIREHGIKLVDRVDDQTILETAWRILTAGTQPTVSAELKPELETAFMAAPYRLAYEAWRTLQDYLEPPKPPSPELQALARRLDRFFGVKPQRERDLQS